MAKRSRRSNAVQAKRHTLRLGLEVKEITRAGSALSLRIYAKKAKIGEMLIGHGRLFWYGARRQRRQHISWTHFSKMMDQLAYGPV